MKVRKSDRIEHIFQFMQYDELTDSQHDLVVKFEKYYEENEFLSVKQYEILEDIFERSSG